MYSDSPRLAGTSSTGGRLSPALKRRIIYAGGTEKRRQCTASLPGTTCEKKSRRTKEEITLEALPTKEGMQVGVLLFRPDDKRILGLEDAAGARALFEVNCVCICARRVTLFL